MSRKKQANLNQTRNVKEKQDLKLPEDIVFEIKGCFNQYNGENRGGLNRHETKSILTNFGFHGLTSREIDEQLARDFEVDYGKQLFTLNELMDIIKKKWFNFGGRVTECEDIYKIFDKKNKGTIGSNDIKAVFHQYLDFTISDQDIMEFINEVGEEGTISYEDFATKMGYQ